MSYEPPKHGSPCWIEVPSTDIARAKNFYSQVFDWNFKAATEDYPEEKVALFSYPDPKLSMLGGGIVKHEQDKMKGGFVVYLYVNSIEETLTKIEDAGGKKIGERYAEGAFGWIQNFEDTEGNSCAMYTAKKESEK